MNYVAEHNNSYNKIKEILLMSMQIFFKLAAQVRCNSMLVASSKMIEKIIKHRIVSTTNSESSVYYFIVDMHWIKKMSLNSEFLRSKKYV